MAHELTETNGVVEFVSGRNLPVWHGLGQTVEGLMTSSEAMEQAHIGWEVESVQCLMETNEGYTAIENKSVIRRKDTQKAFAVMSGKYQIIQNKDAFDFCDTLAGNGDAMFDTAGSIMGGAKVFLNMVIPGKMFVNGTEDSIEKRLLLMTSHDGTGSLLGMITPIRTVCANTLNAGLRNHTNQFKVRHTKNFASKVNEAQRVLGLASAYYDDLQMVIDSLAKEEISKSYAEGFINSLVSSEKEGDDIPKQTMTKRGEIYNLFTNGTGNNGRTKWDLYNAVTEYVDHKSKGRETTTSLYRSDAGADIESEQRFFRSLVGQGAKMKEQAMSLLLN